MTTCTHCGAQMPDGSKFCTVCGAGMAPVAATEWPAQEFPAQAQAPVPAPAQAYPPPPPVPPAYPQNPPPDGEAAPPKGSPYAPISTLGYIGYFILFSLPIVGQILCVAWAFSKKKGNVNRRGLARALFVFLLIGLLSAIASGIFAGIAIQKAGGLQTLVSSWVQQLSVEGGVLEPSGGGTAQQGMNGNGGAAQPAGNGNSGREQTTAPSAPAQYILGDDTVFTAQWPDNQFTRQVPKPSFEVTVGSVTETEFAALGLNTTREQMLAYAKELEKAGFDKNAETTDESAFGLDLFYRYKAGNGKGYEVEISYVPMASTNSIAIRKQ